MRLAKYLAHGGVASRRAAERIVAAGRVTVNGEPVTDPARDIGEGDEVRVDDSPVGVEDREVWAVHKPAGVVSTAREPGSRPAVVELVRSDARLYPVGRLDADSTGLLLLTNDGELANRLTHPRYEVAKVYRVVLRRPASEQDLRRLASGVELDDGPTAPAKVRRLGGREIEVVLREGRNRQVRRMAEAVDNGVASLRRVQFGPIELGDLREARRGALSTEEVSWLWEDAEAVNAEANQQQLYAVRGAVQATANEAEAILAATTELMRELLERNGLAPESMVSCLFTTTEDLDAEFPAVAARGLGLESVPLLCCREIPVPGSMQRVIRAMVHYYAPTGRYTPAHAYLGATQELRSTSTPLSKRRVGHNGRMTVTFAEKLARIPGYQAGVPTGKAPEAIAADGIAQLASNESPFSPHPKVIETIQAAAGVMNRYPDPDATLLRQRIAERYETEPGRIAVGNGSCEILLAAAEALCEPGAEIVYAWPSFSMYPYLAALSGAREIRVPLAEGDAHDLDSMAAEVTAATQLVIVCNPNNPTGTHLPAAEIAALCERVPDHVTIALDEAYVEFQVNDDPDTTVDLLDDFPNLVILRTFSKVYGLAGLRVGFAIGSAKFRAAIDAVRQPFSVNAVAQAAAAEAILHSDDVVRRVESTIAERIRVEDALHEMALKTAATQANFSWVDLGEADEGEVVSGLAERAIAVRAGTPLGGPGHIRVTYGTPGENDRFLAVFEQLLD